MVDLSLMLLISTTCASVFSVFSLLCMTARVAPEPPWLALLDPTVSSLTCCPLCSPQIACCTGGNRGEKSGGRVRFHQVKTQGLGAKETWVAVVPPIHSPALPLAPLRV